MSHALVTFLFPIPTAHQGLVEQALDGLGWHPRPCSPHPLEPGCLAAVVAEAAAPTGRLEDFVHFMSMLVLPRDEDGDDPRSWLLIEVCADGSQDLLPQRLALALPKELASVLEALGDGPFAPDATDALADRLRRHAMPMGTSLLAQPGMCFDGTPGMTVQRIRQEALLAAHVRTLLREDPKLPATALGKLARMRSKVFDDPALKWSLFSEPVPPELEHTGLSRAFSLGLAAVRDYLWVLLPLPLLVALITHFPKLSTWARPESWPRAVFESWSWLADVVLCFSAWLAVELLLLSLPVLLGYRGLRSQEDADDPLDQEPDAGQMGRIMARENYRGVAQNHLAAQSRLKPGWFRRWTLRLALWVIAEVTQVHSKAGFLGKIGTIHFARWYLVPGTDRLLFLSNYDGSWQSYLEDFIARLRQGLSSVWSNTREFPKTNHLISGGAADGARFKRWARRQQLPSSAWFTAYPDLTAASIRTNAAIRHGLASASTEAQAVKWLSRLGYADADALDNDKVPTLVFGGLARLPHAHAVVLRLGDLAPARAWLKEISGEITYGPHDGQRQALVLGFTSTGLHKLGLPSAAMRGFPIAFQQGMGHPDRARLLGDFETHGHGGQVGLRWGSEHRPVDALCLVYADTAAGLQSALQRLEARQRAHGLEIVYQREMAVLPEKNLSTGAREFREAFGFRDGISQPILRGTPGSTKIENAQHVVNPGEIVLGYQDNLGQRPPTPCAGQHDYGRNGSFLVVRHLAQDTEKFDRFLCDQATRLMKHGPRGHLKPEQTNDWEPKHKRMQEWVAAKMVGRWRSGASLVRSPETPGAAVDNDFLYGKEDPDGLRCPFGAHARRANPRDSLDPNSKVQLAISNRHRILRVGRKLDPRGEEPVGMMFMCLNADIERQFEFLQQTWLLGPNFHGLDNETDPLLGPGGRDQAMTVPAIGGPTRLEPLSRFVRALGGGYFFLPGKQTLDRLADASREGPDE